MSQNSDSISETQEELLRVEKKQEASKLQKQEESKPSDQEASKSIKQETSEPQEQESSKIQEQETSKLQEQETSKPQEQKASIPQEQQVSYFPNFIHFWKNSASSKTSDQTPETQEKPQSVEETQKALIPTVHEVPPTIASLPSLRSVTGQFSDALYRQANTLSEKASTIKDRELKKGLLDIADSVRELSIYLRSFNDSQVLCKRHFQTIFADPDDEKANEINAEVFNSVAGEMAELVEYIRSVADNLKFCAQYIRYMSGILDDVIWMDKVQEFEHSHVEDEAA